MLFGKAAESSYVTGIQKGTQVFVEGELQHRKYQEAVGKEKVEWPVTEILVSSLKKLGKARKSDAAGAVPQSGSEFLEEITDAGVPF